MPTESVGLGHSSYLFRGPSPRKPRELVVAVGLLVAVELVVAVGLLVAAVGGQLARYWGETNVLKKLLIVAGIVTVAALVVKKVKASSDERALWHEATNAPDLR